MVDTQKLNELAKSLYDHRLATSMDEAVKMAEKILTGGKGEARSAGIIPKDAPKKDSEPTPEPEGHILAPEESGLSAEDIKEEQEIEKEIKEIESPEEEAQDQAVMDELQQTKEELKEATVLDVENTAGAEGIQRELGEEQKETVSLRKDFESLEKIPEDAKAVQTSEWEASKVDEFAKKKLPGQELLKDADKIYEEESKEEE